MAEPKVSRTPGGGMASPASEACLEIAIIVINGTRTALLLGHLAVPKTPSLCTCVYRFMWLSLYICDVLVEVPTPPLPM